MEGPDLLKALMSRAKLNSNSLAGKLDNKSMQSHVYRYLKGIAKQPKRETLEPIAKYFGVPLAAFYDPALAEQVAMEHGLIDGTPTTGKSPTTEKTLSPSDALDAALEVLSKALTELDEEGRSLVGHSLSRLAQDPSKLGNISQHIRTLVFTNVAKSPAPDNRGEGQRLTDLQRGIGPEEDGEHLRVSPARRGQQK